MSKVVMINGLDEIYPMVKIEFQNPAWFTSYSHLNVEKEQKFKIFFRTFVIDGRWSPGHHTISAYLTLPALSKTVKNFQKFHLMSKKSSFKVITLPDHVTHSTAYTTRTTPLRKKIFADSNSSKSKLSIMTCLESIGTIPYTEQIPQTATRATTWVILTNPFLAKPTWSIFRFTGALIVES